MSDTQPSTPASTTETTPTPSTPATPTGAAQPTPAPPTKGPDLSGLKSAVRQAVSRRQQEVAATKQAEALKPLQEVQALVQQGKLAEAFQKLAGQDRLTEGYQQLTDAVLGTKDEEAKLAALPKSVREQLEELRRFKEEATGKVATVEQLQAELAKLKEERDGARQAFEAREREARAARAFTTGLEALKGAEGMELLRAHPQHQELVQQAWVELLKSKVEEMKSMPPQDRHEFAGMLVMAAAKSVQERLVQESEWLLNSDYARSKLLGEVKPVGSKGSAPLKSSAKSTPAPTNSPPPRTSPPGSLGEPSGVDLSRLSYRDRVNLLKEEERRGFKPR